jgi:hypothetical protein
LPTGSEYSCHPASLTGAGEVYHKVRLFVGVYAFAAPVAAKQSKAASLLFMSFMF